MFAAVRIRARVSDWSPLFSRSGQWLGAALTAAAFAAGAAWADQEPRLVTPNDATTGTLLFKSSTQGKYVQAPSLLTDVQIDISGPIARTRVTQRFENTTDGWVEGVYVFPLPDESAVDTLRMQIGDRFIEGMIEEKKKAKAIYEQAKSEGKKTALLEQERPNLFTNSVANIGPGETIIVQIEYQETVHLTDDTFSLRFPMTVAPRYMPAPEILTAALGEEGWAVVDPVPDRDRISPPVLNPELGNANPLTLNVSLDAGFPVGKLESTYHPMDTEWSGNGAANLTLSSGSTYANRDFELTWTPKASKAPSAALFTETIGGEPYYLLMVTPPVAAQSAPPPPREITFIIDTSGSMGGESIRQARDSLALAIARLKPEDRFNVIEFNSVTHALFDHPLDASKTNRARATRWVNNLEATGGTEMLPALREALADHGTGDGRLRQVIFLTDGAIGNEQQLFETITQYRADARIFTVGIGSAPNSFFMSRAAELGQGSYTYIGDIDEVAARMGALFTRLESPAITSLAATWPDGTKVEAWPSPLPDVYSGETLVIAAHAAAKDGLVWVSGLNGDQPWKVGLPLKQAAKREGISKLWARKKIASLELDRARADTLPDLIDDQILSVALAHHLVSRLTSLVAVDVTPSRPDGAELDSAQVPLNLPAGWDFGKVFGHEGIRSDAPMIPVDALAIRKPDAQKMNAPMQVDRGVPLPNTGTLSDLKLLAGIILVLLGFMVKLVFRRIRLRHAM
ncbi:marine proteobacterial sortase target protein [Hyphomonas oceanitis]|uniref:Transmembrane protein n=1 Tax=Hyphomonas oceanitis SCH89 TaxID=1280953 RepID=A0A059G9L7_9PROT|nr:marine proteobacterial sortase target protein [Hyphomonas oceanitis]KDA03178.1 transmembrane protein [Hyphomonas oceanitis SCH89]